MRRSAHGWLGLGVLLVGALVGCRHQGADWQSELPDNAEAIVELFVVGQPRAGHTSELVMTEIDRQVGANTGPRNLIWLGTDLGPVGPDRSGRCSNAVEQLDELDLAEDAWGLPGPDLLRCGVALEPSDAARPWQQPGLAYVLRVSTSGAIELVSRCDARTCEVTLASEAPLVELVLLDLSHWVYPDLLDPDATAETIAQQSSLLDALAAQPATPRVLISPIPIESAGSHGLGGRRQRTSYRYLPEFVQAAIADGMFVGAIGALERDLQVSADLSNAIVRGDRSFVARPLFGINAGSAGGAGHTLVTSRGESVRLDLWTEHPGFVRLRITAREIEIHVHTRVGGRWRTTMIPVPLDPAPLESLREPPTMPPCPSCDPQSGAAGQVFVPRNERRR